jgi:hypothetical protein
LGSIRQNAISKEIPLPDGSRIVLVDMLYADNSIPDADIEDNIFRLAVGGEILWQVHGSKTVYARSPFTGIWLDQDARLKGHCWDGVEYEIAIGTGEAAAPQFVK